MIRTLSPIQAKTVTATRLQPRFDSSVNVMPTNMVRSGSRPAGTSGDMRVNWAQIKGTLITKYGLSSSQADSTIARFQALGKVPSMAEIETYVNNLRGIPTTGKITVDDVDEIIGTNGGGSGVTMSPATGFDIVTPGDMEQSFFQKNKIPILIGGGAVAVGLIYLLTRKKK